MDIFSNQNTSAFKREALKLSAPLNQRFKEVPSLSEQDILNYFTFDRNQQNLDKVLKLALDYDIDLTNSKIHLPLKILRENKDLFLKHHNPMKTELFFYLTIAQNYSTEEEYKTQSEFLNLALDSSVDINILLRDISDRLYYHYKLGFLLRNQDILLNHPTNPVNKEWFFKEFFSYYPSNSIEIDLVKLTLDHGVDITKVKSYFNLEFLSRHQDILLNHPTNPVSKEWLFKEALSRYPSDEKGYKLQAEFVKLALDHNIDITKIDGLYLNLEFLSRNQDILLNHSTNPVNKEWFFKEALFRYPSDEKGYQAQSHIVKLALEHGFDFYSIADHYLNLDFFYNNKELLLNHPYHAMKKEMFFKLAFSASMSVHSESKKSELLKLAINSNVEVFNLERMWFSIEILMENFDLLLNNCSNKEQLDKFYLLVLAYNTNNESYLAKQTETLKLALDSGIDFNKVSYLSFTLLATNKELLLNHPTNPVHPDLILKYILQNTSDVEVFDKNLQYQIAKELIELGANADQEIQEAMGTASILTIINDTDLYNLLKDHGATCGKASVNYEKYLKLHPQLEKFLDNQSEYFSKTDENLQVSSEYVNKIPYSINHVWLTHASSPREMRNEDIENVILTKNTFGGNLSKWKHIIWTNNKNLIPKSVKTLEENGIEVRDISEYQDQLKLYDTVNALADKKLWGMASDALRYEIIAKFGGIYADLNYQFTRSIEKDIYKYDFFAQDFINYFFAAKPNHSILNDLVKTMYEHFNNEPEYLTNFSAKHVFDKTVLFSLLPFTTAIIENYNKDGNIDMVVGLSHRLEFNETCSLYGYYKNYSYEESYSYNSQFTNYCPSFWNALNIGFSPSSESEALRVGKDGYKDAHLTWIEEDSGLNLDYLGNSYEYKNY